MAPILPSEEAGDESVIAEPGGVELAKMEKAAEAAAEGAGAAGESAEAEEVGIYHPVVPELLEAFTEAVDILEKLSIGTMSLPEAKAHYLDKVKAPSDAVAIDTTKTKPTKKQTRSRRRSRTSQSKRSSKK